MPRTPIYIESTPELRKQLNILMAEESLSNRTQLFCNVLKESKYAKSRPQLVAACTEAETVFAGKAK
jgi:hypothetical protein